MTIPLTRMRALIVDDHEMIAQGIAVALDAAGVQTEVTSGPTSEAVITLAERHQPDVVLLDLQIGGEIGSGLSLIEPLKQLGARVLVVTGVTDRAALGECIEAGAVGVASKSEGFDALVDKILRAATGDSVMTRHEEYALIDEARRHREADRTRLEPFAALTPREQTVLWGLMEGKQADALAGESYVSISTIRTQIRAVLRKLEVNSQLAAVAMAREAEWRPDAAIYDTDQAMIH